jgi:hypothetical protein
MSSAAAELRSDALRHGADEAAVDLAIAQLSTPDHPTYDSVVDIGRRVSIRHPGRGHTDADLIVVVPASSETDRTVVFCGDLVEESGDPAIDAGSDVAAWPGTLDRLLVAGGLDAVYVPVTALSLTPRSSAGNKAGCGAYRQCDESQTKNVTHVIAAQASKRTPWALNHEELYWG